VAELRIKVIAKPYDLRHTANTLIGLLPKG
jgi:hypothetical protein